MVRGSTAAAYAAAWESARAHPALTVAKVLPCVRPTAGSHTPTAAPHHPGPTCGAAEHAAVCCEEGVLLNVPNVAGQQLADHHCSSTHQLRAQVRAGSRGGQRHLGLVLGLQDRSHGQGRGTEARHTEGT